MKSCNKLSRSCHDTPNQTYRMPILSDEAVIQIQDFLHLALDMFEDHYSQQLERVHQSIWQDSPELVLGVSTVEQPSDSTHRRRKLQSWRRPVCASAASCQANAPPELPRDDTPYAPKIAWDRESELLRDVTKSFEAADFGLVFNAFQKGHEMPTAGVAFTGTHGAARQSACTHHQQAHHHYLTG